VPAQKRFKVFGEPVEVLVSSSSTGGSSCAITQTSPPGGGPPPHWHANEDELFMALEGEFELFDGKDWHKLPNGEMAFAHRGNVHTFRNCGKTTGKILCVATPGGLDEYLEAISILSIPTDIERLTEISNSYGITFALPSAAS
jgi:quercetin dioxygenase-like cupin family protein